MTTAKTPYVFSLVATSPIRTIYNCLFEKEHAQSYNSTLLPTKRTKKKKKKELSKASLLSCMTEEIATISYEQTETT